MIDNDGFRANVGIILLNGQKQVFWGRRVTAQNAWQFPQGGILPNESTEEAMYRELHEEIGLESKDVEILGVTKEWLYYRLPEHYVRKNSEPLCIGQKQKWYLLKLVTSDESICLTKGEKPEFEEWDWVDFWYPLNAVVNFKRRVYQQALREFSPIAFPDKKLRNPKQRLRSALRPRRKFRE